MVSYVRVIVALFLSLVIIILIRQYFLCPTYSFRSGKPFAGSNFYNPYDSINEKNWVKCNFHAHTNAWHGFTNGRGNAANVYHAYDSLGYGIHCVSNYQKIDRTFEDSPGYIPAYEHGYNMGKTHQLVLGSRSVKWIEYLFPQTLSNKQHILDRLAGPETLVIINHPSAFHGYRPADFRYLSAYQCVEVLSPYAISTNCWDTALSNGKAAFIVGDDDEHNIFCTDCLGRMCTWVNVSSIDEQSVLNALKKGRSYGMVVGKGDSMPMLKNFRINGDTISVTMSEPAAKISFIGQGGRLLDSVEHTGSGSYLIKPGDTYVRAVADYPQGRSILLNPVFRYNKTTIASGPSPINRQMTTLKRIVGWLIMLGWVVFAIRFVRRKRR